MCIEAGSLYATTVLILVDFPLNAIYNLVFFKGVFLLSLSGILFYYLSCAEFLQLNELLSQLKTQNLDSALPELRYGQFHLVHALSQFRFRHANMTRFIIHYNKRMVSKVRVPRERESEIIIIFFLVQKSDHLLLPIDQFLLQRLPNCLSLLPYHLFASQDGLHLVPGPSNVCSILWHLPHGHH